ncbi:hypothetical protein FQN54_008837 [Arachnomyces sp. PD_36]|nr:hypothetical protein FQN54_008837 [Arachnomyces sp. PD_36]
MNVKGFIYGKETHGPVSPQKGDKPNPRISRQAVAGKARVGVPPTRLTSQPFPALANLQPPERQENPVNDPHYEAIQEQQAQNGRGSPGKHADMFDTDVEGIDDSTIASGSVVYSDENQPYQTQPPAFQGGINRGLNSQNHHPQNINDLRGWADRLASELPSDSEESGGGDDQETQRLRAPPAQNEGGSDAEHVQEYDAGGNTAPSGGTASSRIEAALRDTGRRPGLRQPYPTPSLNRGSLPPFTALPQRQDIGGDTQANYNNQPDYPQRSQSPGTIPIRGRFNRNHRLLDSYSSHPRVENDASNANNPSSQVDHPVSVKPDAPQSPVRAPRTNPPSPRKAVRPTLVKSNTSEGVPNSKSFDLTDLSALDDSSDSIDKSDIPAPSQRQKRPATTPKLPFHTYGTDYPAEVLLSKPFSDLKSESFDFDPSPQKPALFPTKRSSLNLSEELPRLKNLTADQRRDFFSSLTISQWEECGDLLIEQFGAILQNVKNARHERRKVAAAFEKEVERRYDDVESKGKDLDKRLVEMRTGGLEVLKGRTP